MNVSSANSVNFSGKTKQNNEYKKTHMGLVTGLVAGALTLPATSAIQSIVLTKDFKNSIKGTFNVYTKDLYRMKIAKPFLISGAILAGGFGILGIIQDAIANKKIAKNVDNTAANL